MEELPLDGDDLTVARAQQAEEDRIFAMQNVVGLGVGRRVTGGEQTDEPCLSVFVTQKMPESLLRERDRVPRALAGVKTDVLETGDFFAGQHVHANGRTAELPGAFPPAPDDPLELDEEADDVASGRRRPARPGDSVGHYRVSAGTIGAAVLDAESVPGVPRRYLLLSNNHVLANANDARIGDPILQPGPADGGRHPRDRIGRLLRFVPIRFGAGPGGDSGPVQTNFVDAAVAEVAFHDLERAIFWVGVPRGTATVRPGTLVQKTGRTTRYSTGRVGAVNVSVNVNYGGSRVARFVRQIVTSGMSAGGDSGSLVLDQGDRAVGLLFAASSRATVVSPIQLVEAQLAIRVGF